MSKTKTRAETIVEVKKARGLKCKRCWKFYNEINHLYLFFVLNIE